MFGSWRATCNRDRESECWVRLKVGSGKSNAFVDKELQFELARGSQQAVLVITQWRGDEAGPRSTAGAGQRRPGSAQ